MYRMSLNRFVHINSFDRLNGNSNNCIIQLDKPIDFTKRNKRMKLVNFVIPNTIYNITTNNYNIPFFEDSTSKNTQLTPGYYTASTLATHISTQMTSTSSGYATFTASYSSTTMKITISSTQNFGLEFESGTNASTSLWRELGYTQTDTSTGTTSHVASNCINLAIPYTIYIQVDILGSNNIVESNGNESTFIVPITNGNSTLINYREKDNFLQEAQLNTGINLINKIRIRLEDRNRNLIEINNSDWEMLLEIL